MANLLEAYKNRLKISESVYSKSHEGAKMDNNKKLCVAKCLENCNRFLNEAFDASVGTQRSDMGLWKKFCLNLTTVALPNLIAHDLVIVHPMSSMSGFITYINYTAGTNKGNVQQGDLFNNPFMLGDVDGTRDGVGNGYTANYTSQKVVEAVTSFTSGTSKVAWFPVVAGSIRALDADGNEVSDPAGTAWTAAADGTITAGSYVSGKSATDVAKIAYEYDNIVIPQNDLPILNAKIESIPLVAKARRIAVYYSQIAAFQAKTDYGFDLGDQLAEKAVGQLSYEIDTEITNMLIENAPVDAVPLTWSKTLPVGVSKAEHYEGFSEVIEIARQRVYDRTKRFAPNWMLISSNILPVLTFMKGFTAAPAGQINGPYYAGTLNSLKVFVTPNIEPGTFVIGVNGSDLMSSAAVYAPYMAIVPTQLLQYADGGTSQGWSTLYDLKMLNPNLLVKGTVTEAV